MVGITKIICLLSLLNFEVYDIIQIQLRDTRKEQRIMKECFHFTKSRFLKSILENGLQPSFGANCSIIGDGKGEKVSYSIGTEEATKMFKGVYEIYCRMADGRVNEESYDEIGKKAIAELQSSRDFESWEEPGVYLTFNGENINGSNMDESKPYDSYTNMTIPPEQLKVCVIKNKETGEIISSKYDVVCFWIAKSNNKESGFYNIEYKDRIKEFQSEKYEMDYMGLDVFCKMYPEKLEEKIATNETHGFDNGKKEGIVPEKLLPKTIEETKSDFALVKIAQLIRKITNKVKKVFNKDKLNEQSPENTTTDSYSNNSEYHEDSGFIGKLSSEVKTLEETIAEIGSEGDNKVASKAIITQDKSEI